MQQLSQIVDSVGQKINQKLDAAACKLLYNTKQMDLTLPVRFANIPSGSTLELQSGAARQPSSYSSSQYTQRLDACPALPCNAVQAIPHQKQCLYALSQIPFSLQHLSNKEVNAKCHIDTQAGSERQLGIRDGQPEDVQPSVSEHAAGPSSSSGHSGLQQSPRASMPSAAQPTAPDHSTPEPSIPTGTTTEPASVQLSMPGSAEAPAAPHEPARMHRSMMDTTDAPAAVSQPTAQPRSALGTAEASGTAQQTAEGSMRASIAAQQSKEADSTKHEPDAPEGMDPVGLGRPILLFRREAMAGQAGSAGNATGDREPDDSYYEFTADDYHRSVAALCARLAAVICSSVKTEHHATSTGTAARSFWRLTCLVDICTLSFICQA